MHRVYRQYVCLFCVWKHSFLGLLGNSNVNIVPFHSIVHFTTHKRWKVELELRANIAVMFQYTPLTSVQSRRFRT